MKDYIEGIVAPIDRDNIDTDQIIPTEYLKSIKKFGYEDKPPISTSCLKLSNCFSLNLPSRKALAYIPGAL